MSSPSTPSTSSTPARNLPRSLTRPATSPTPQEPTTPPTTSPSDNYPLQGLNEQPLAVVATVYAHFGWPVLPLKPRDKTPLTRNGNKNATTDHDQITDWWLQWPDANIGLLTGPIFDVLDLDGPEAVAAVNALAPGYKHNGPISSTGKGYHLLFAATGSRNHAKMADAPLDFRGEGGYIVAPPSIHPKGHRYSWARSGPLPAAPDWLTALLFPPKPERKTAASPDIEAFIDANDILAMFTAMGAQVTRAGGPNWRTACIFHQDDTPSLVIYTGTQSFYCFGCGAWGDALNLKRWQTEGRLR